MKSSRNPGLLIVFLLIAVAMAVAFFPGVNENVARGLAEIVPIDTEGLDGATRTIFDSITYALYPHPGHAAGGIRVPDGLPAGP